MTSIIVLIGALLCVSGFSSSKASVVINEIAYKGSEEGNCNGEDWIELLNTGENGVDLSGYLLHDDKGSGDDEAMALAEGITMAPGSFLVFCKDVDFEFGIGSSDTVTLLDPNGILIDSVSLSGNGTDDETFALFISGGKEYKYTTLPTPGTDNIYEERVPLKEKLLAQNNAGDDFFLSSDTLKIFGKVVDIDISIDEESLTIIQDHPAWEIYVPFKELSVSNAEDESPNTIATSSRGRIRTKGQSSNSITACMGTKNVPFQIKFDEPFQGIEVMYLRNHLGDASYMRDHGSHTMLKALGLPYLRTRPARIFMNGKYIGFYTLMEAPDQAYVMQRSFGDFDPDKTALFKAKTGMGECPYSDTMLAYANFASDSPPDPYYFERGDHRADLPVLGTENMGQCFVAFLGELFKDRNDMMRGYFEYDKNCGLAMVKLGRVDRDFGPKDLEDSMISFLENKFYDTSIEDLTDSIDTEQWLQNIAIYTLMLNFDSPIGRINNWYLATVEGGFNDWKIVQYDHSSVALRDNAGICAEPCGPRMVYWPILQPTCTSIKEHKIVGRVLNSEENMQKYLGYLQEFVDILIADDVLPKLVAYGHGIKGYVIEDPLNFNYPSLESYEEEELGSNTIGYNSQLSPFLKVIRKRLEEIQKQLDAIREGSLPLDGEYDPRSSCPDWRDNNRSEDYITSSVLGEDCAIPGCRDAATCYSSCSPEGEMLIEDCKAVSPYCDSCFPYSRCGTLENDHSSTIIESKTCGPQLAVECAASAFCFDHKSGNCAFDGEILTVECRMALPACTPCYPYSRCGSGEAPETNPDQITDPVPLNSGSGLFVESESCGPSLVVCSQASGCFDHDIGFCGDDGSFTIEGCQRVQAFCKPCFPNSRCGAGGGAEVAASSSEGMEDLNPVVDEASHILATSSIDHRQGASSVIRIVVMGLLWFGMEMPEIFF